MRNAEERVPLTMRLTRTGKELLEQLATARGVSLTAVVEQMIRDEAKQEGISREQVKAEA